MDHANALNYFQQAADAGNAIAMVFLGKMYLEGSEAVVQNNEKALKDFKKAAALDNPVGQSWLGLMYLYSKGVEVDFNKAFDYFQKAVEHPRLSRVRGRVEVTEVTRRSAQNPGDGGH